MSIKRTSLMTAATVLALSSFAAHAADASLSGRAATGIGQYIAAQGNAALAELRQRFVAELSDRIQLFVPEPPAELEPAVPAEPGTDQIN
ncbi:hypothetical protein RM530_11405 [Algiphilus sp. W345]|uniref:Uncharacterized protein n=1 Tax=Banduia mediterranea TaxID=3075609 RepID=A0ABU2WL79_9GAMM|nr:hypothetical protein [Algiphilus sp. W345]MDT0497964.1 hypothetical protein [Algiphilus sp. W345]